MYSVPYMFTQYVYQSYIVFSCWKDNRQVQVINPAVWQECAKLQDFVNRNLIQIIPVDPECKFYTCSRRM